MTAAGGKFTTEPPATCGPYRLDPWSPRRSITLVADPDWPGPGPAFAKIRYEIIEDTDAGALAFEAGAVDCARIGLIAYESYRKRLPEGARLMTGPGSRFSFLAINLAHPKLADPRLRRAIQRAVDPAEINLGAYAGLRSVATGVLNATMPGHRDAVLYPPDRAAAKALMVEAGITPLTLHLDILNDPEAALVAQILASQLAAVGITLDVAIHDEAIFWSLGVKADGEDWRGLELVLIEFTGGIDPTENLLSFRPEQIGLYNWGQFDSPDYEKLYQESLIDPDPDRRAALFRRMQDLMEDSGGFVFLTFDSFAAIHRADVAPFVTPENYYDPGRFGRL
jgi:peptide/nickel transport system substrate-binding protein